jgi:GT2 family glycosyltransferase
MGCVDINYWVTIVIPTFKRAALLSHLIEALKRQTYRNFDVIVVVKPSGDGTEALLTQASSALKITMVLQTSGHIVDGYFLGVKASKGDIVAFLDDDAIPADNWLEETVKLFHAKGVSAVTGDSYPVLIENDGIRIIPEEELPSVMSHYEFALFGSPIKGLEEYKNAIAASGLVYERGNNAYWRRYGNIKALLRGPSMAVWGDLLRDIELSGEWILGCAWEMVLGWHIWKRGYKLVFSPNVKVYHNVHGRTSSPDYLKPRTDLLWAVEAELLFYRLYREEPQLSICTKFRSDIFRVLHTLKNLKSNPKYQLRRIEGLAIANIIGAKWLLHKRLGAPYSPLPDLNRFRPKKQD